MFVVEIPLFWKPTVRKEFPPALAAAVAPRVKRLDASMLALKTSAVDVASAVSPVKSQEAIWARVGFIKAASKMIDSTYRRIKPFG